MRYLAGLIVILGLFAWWQAGMARDPKLELITPGGEVVNSESKQATITWNETDYVVRWFVIDDVDGLELGTNLPESRYVKDIVKQDECRQLINGGFYGKDFKPLGWIVNKGEELSPSLRSDLLNGYLSVIGNEVKIVKIKPDGEVMLGVQSGPVLVMSAKPIGLMIANDEPRRRSVAMLTDEGKLMFAIVYKQGSLYVGPFLKDLPEVLMEVANKIDVRIEVAMNLDGGTASAFWDGEELVEELNPIGSYFCVR